MCIDSIVQTIARMGTLIARMGTLIVRMGTLIVRMDTSIVRMGTSIVRMGTLIARMDQTKSVWSILFFIKKNPIIWFFQKSFVILHSQNS